MSTDQYIIQVSGLTKTYGKETVVKQLDLNVRPGQCYGLLGPNGAGKSTTIGMLLGTTLPSAGSLQVLGHAIPQQAHLARRSIGVVPQDDNLDPDFTVEQNLQVYASYFQLPKAVVNERIEKLLDFVELRKKRKEPIPALSGGMRRRLTIARALINDPELVVLDEPTTGLDPQVRHLIWSRLRELQKQGKTLLITTHYMEEAERLCDDLVVIDHGEIISQGAPAQLVAEQVEPEVFELPSADASLVEALRALPDARVEQSGTAWYCYTEQAAPVLALLQQQTGLRYLHRPSNLEDVFLRLTRRELRD